MNSIETVQTKTCLQVKLVNSQSNIGMNGSLLVQFLEACESQGLINIVTSTLTIEDEASWVIPG